LLNLAWLLLVLPAYGIWRQGALAKRQNRFNSLQGLLALGCLLVLLFPIISATDDLHAMRAEMEEPGTSKRSVRQASPDKFSVKVSRLNHLIVGGLIVELVVSVILWPTLYAFLARAGDKLPPSEQSFMAEGEHVDYFHLAGFRRQVRSVVYDLVARIYPRLLWYSTSG
jgi:hypothetical protein